MKFIPEKIIDVKAAELGQAAQGLGLRDTVQHFKAAQPALLFYLFSSIMCVRGQRINIHIGPRYTNLYALS